MHRNHEFAVNDRSIFIESTNCGTINVERKEKENYWINHKCSTLQTCLRLLHPHHRQCLNLQAKQAK